MSGDGEGNDERGRSETTDEGDDWLTEAEISVGLKSLEFEAAAAVEKRSAKVLWEHCSIWEPKR